MSRPSTRRVARYWIALALGSACVLASIAPAAQDSGKHFLWRITNAPAPFYLLGSVHALRPQDYHKTPAIEEAITQSQQFFFEIDPKQDETFGKKLVEAAKYPHGVQIKGKINPKTYEYLRKITVSGIPGRSRCCSCILRDTNKSACNMALIITRPAERDILPSQLTASKP